jgi:hypothetical protein
MTIEPAPAFFTPMPQALHDHNEASEAETRKDEESNPDFKKWPNTGGFINLIRRKKGLSPQICIDMSFHPLANHHKQLGRDAHQANDYRTAINEYTNAIVIEFHSPFLTSSSM